MATSQMNGARMFNPDLENVEEFLQRFRVQNFRDLNAEGVTSSVKAMLLANSLPINVLTDLQRRLKPVTLTVATFDQIESQLKASFCIKKSLIGASVQFLTRKQKPHESIETYSQILNELASHCDYPTDSCDRLLRDAFVSGLRSHKLISNLIADCEEKTFTQSVDRAKLLQQFSQDVEEIHPNSSVRQFKVYKPNHVDSSRNHTRHTGSNVPTNYVCIRCGEKAKHFAHKCYAIDKTCNKCSKTGHISKVCRSKKPQVKVISSNYVHPEEFDQSEYIAINTLHSDCDSEISSPVSVPVSLPSTHVSSLFIPLKNSYDAINKFPSYFTNDKNSCANDENLCSTNDVKRQDYNELDIRSNLSSKVHSKGGVNLRSGHKSADMTSTQMIDQSTTTTSGNYVKSKSCNEVNSLRSTSLLSSSNSSFL